jgi:hypothetical protein
MAAMLLEANLAGNAIHGSLRCGEERCIGTTLFHHMKEGLCNLGHGRSTRLLSLVDCAPVSGQDQAAVLWGDPHPSGRLLSLVRRCRRDLITSNTNLSLIRVDAPSPGGWSSPLNLALPRFVWLLCCAQQALAEQVELGAAVHGSFEQLQLVDLPFSLTVAPRQGELSEHDPNLTRSSKADAAQVEAATGTLRRHDFGITRHRARSRPAPASTCAVTLHAS